VVRIEVIQLFYFGVYEISQSLSFLPEVAIINRWPAVPAAWQWLISEKLLQPAADTKLLCDIPFYRIIMVAAKLFISTWIPINRAALRRSHATKIRRGCTQSPTYTKWWRTALLPRAGAARTSVYRDL